MRRLLRRLAVFSIVLTSYGCREVPVERRPSTAPRGIVLTDVTEAVGLAFVHDAGLDGSHFMPEIMGPGVALFDCDGDGDLDVYLVNGGSHSGEDGQVNRLFRQEPNGQFVDVTAASGLGDAGYGMGVAIGDIDNDGDEDVYVTNYGPDALYRNDGFCRFTDITTEAGIDNPGWSSSAAFLDYDADGWLDIYVANFLDYDPARVCYGGTGELIYCGPVSFSGTPDRLYRNLGNGRFADVSLEAGIGAMSGKGLGVVALDLTGDGRTDIFVANDGERNWLWVNQGDGRFVDEGLGSGLAVNEYGEAEASMGIAVGDIDGDESFDLFLTHLSDETNTLYLSAGRFFEDVTARSGLAMPSLPYTAFGTLALDLDFDSDLDLVWVCGEVGSGKLKNRDGSFEQLYGQPNQLFENLGQSRFRGVENDFTRAVEVSRGLAAGDLDRDGDLDLVVTNASGRARVFRNDSPKAGGFVCVRPFDPELKRIALGAVVELTVGNRRLRAPVLAASSYLSSSEPIACFGIGDSASADELTVQWPDGTRESFGPIDAGLTVDALRGTGRAEANVVAMKKLKTASPTVVAPQVSQRRASFGTPVRDVLDDSLIGAEPQVRAVFDEARAEVEEHPDDAQRWGQLGMLYHAHIRREAALACYTRAAERDGADFRWPYLIGVALELREPTRALSSFEASLALSSELVPAMIRRARSLRRLGRNEEANESYRRALTVDRQSAAADLGLGQLALSRGDHAVSLRHLRRAVARAPYSAQARLELSKLFVRLGDKAGAKREAAIAEQLDSTTDILVDPLVTSIQRMNVSQGAVLERAALLRRQGKTEKALEELNRLMAIVSPNAVLLNNRAVVHLERGALDEAFKDLETALALEPANGDILTTRAFIRLRLGETKEALSDLDRALTQDASHLQARLARSDLHRDAGRTSEALADLDAALASDPRHVPALVRRARVLWDLDQADAARADIGLALKLSPGNAEARALAAQLRGSPSSEPPGG